MNKTILAAALACGAISLALPAGAGAARDIGGDTITIDENGVTIDTGIRCVTEPCPSRITIPIPPA